MKLHYQYYKGIWYAFKKEHGLFSKDCWVISDREDLNGNVMYINADKYRIDQCIEIFLKEMSKHAIY